MNYQDVLNEFDAKGQASYASYIEEHPAHPLESPTFKEVYVDSSSKVQMAFEILELRKAVENLKADKDQLLGKIALVHD